ncbi:MAG: cupredoxin domain-containing protein [Thermotogota bacterium]
MKDMTLRRNPKMLAGLAFSVLLVGIWAVLAMGAEAFAVELTAQGFAFDKPVVTVPAGAAVTLHFVNNDGGIPHNVAIYESSEAKTVIFQGKRITGQNSIDYTFTAPTTPGAYFFRCDVHPRMMTGQFVVVPAVVIDVAAQQMAFDVATITVPAGAFVRIHFANQDDGVPHNIAVYDSAAATTTFFQGAQIVGAQTADYTFFAPSAPGSYFFRCDVHPATMTGDFVVAPAIVVNLTAKKMAFDVATITVPAGAYVTLHFTNSDAGIPHNFALYDSAATQTVYFQGIVVAGSAVVDYTFFAPSAPGTYFFRCDVHPTFMTGDFVVTSP